MCIAVLSFVLWALLSLFRLRLHWIRPWTRHVCRWLHLEEAFDGCLFIKRDFDLVAGVWHVLDNIAVPRSSVVAQFEIRDT